jgi:hypothetical protein
MTVSEREEANRGERGKRPYETPRLEIFGAIREITESVGMKGMRADGAIHGRTKTS